MNEQVLDLSKLTDFLLNTLNSTEGVKKILQSQCGEAKLALAPWPLETTMRRELTEISCTCEGAVSTAEHVKEIASGIERAVAQARQLREKLAINVLEEKKLARRPSVQQIYAPGSKKVENKTRIVGSSKLGKENGNKIAGKLNNNDNFCLKNNSRMLKTTETCKRDEKTVVDTRQPCSSKKKILETRRITDKKLVATSPYNSLVAASKSEQKSKEKKNFIAANKSSLKHMKPAYSKICSSQSSAATKSSESLISRAASAVELENLISKISLESENGLIKSAASCTKGNGCFVHDPNAPKFVEEKTYTTLDVAEGLDRFGIPSELVKVLKVYHSYLNGKSINTPIDKRGERAAHRFLEEFTTMNKERQKTSTREKLDDLCKDFLPVLKDSCNKKVDFIESSRLKIRYTNLDSICKMLNIRNFSPTKRKLSNMVENRLARLSLDLNETWKSNAVWNETCISKLNGMFSAHCIRYSSRNQLLTLFDVTQKIQQLKYRERLLDLLNNEVVPLVRNSLEPASREYVDAFKMISTISNLYNLRVPVLETDHLYYGIDLTFVQFRERLIDTFELEALKFELANRTDNKIMETQYVYTKTRAQFGRWCTFLDSNSKMEVNIAPEPSLMHNFVRKDPISQGTQCSKIYAEHEVNTTTATYREGGMHHVEGGWPKDINTNDLEQTVRYRRKIEKDELYIHTMLQLLPPMEHYILQNNACDIYEQYFNDTDAVPLVQKTFSRTVNVYRDPLPMKRSITHLSWSPDQGTRLAISYCDTDFKKSFNSSPNSYIWDVENPNNPFMTLKPFCPNLTIEYNPKDSNALVSGTTSGQVVSWDLRRGSEPVETSLVEQSHREPCNKVLWINSKTGTEFFSASNDGQIKWWDTRKLQTPTETLVIDLLKPEEQDVGRATGISALQFEPSMGTRFMCGLENGMVISGNRKGKTPGEKIATRFKAQYGPVISVERNPTFVKNFLTVGDWTARIWSEDCRESCIAWTPGHRDLLTSGAWSATRFSVFFLTKMDGTMDVWDILVQQDSPVLSVKVCDDALTCIRPHEHGHLAAVASRNGTTYLVEFSEALTINQKNDKLLLTALLERETRREKVIEAKNRETRLKLKSGRVEVEPEPQENSSVKLDASKINEAQKLNEEDPVIIQCEQDYQQAVDAEIMRQTSLENSEVNNNHLQNGFPAAH